MGWLATTELWQGRGGSYDDQRNRGAVRMLRVQMNDRNEDEADVIAQFKEPSGSPGTKVFDQHPTITSLYCKSVSAFNESPSAYFWLITLTYDTEINDPRYAVDDITQRPQEDSGGPVRFQKPATDWYPIDPATGLESSIRVPVTSSAGGLFDPPPEIDASRFEFECLFYSLTIPPYFNTYQDVVNDSIVIYRGFTINPGCLKVNVYYGSYQQIRGTSVRQIKHKFEYVQAGFNASAPDRDYNYLDAGGKLKKITVNGSEPSLPFLLNGKGGPLGLMLDGVMAAGSPVLTNTSFTKGPFVSTDLNSVITVSRAGAAGADLVSKIISVDSALQVTLKDNAVGAVGPGTTLGLAQVNWIQVPQFRKGRVYEKKPFGILKLPSANI